MKFIPWLVYEHFILFAHGWTRLICISWTLWFELLRIRRWTHISPWYVLDALPGNPGALLLLSSSFWHLVEMLSRSISFFYSMPTKSLTMPYHLNKGKQSTERRVNSWINYSLGFGSKKTKERLIQLQAQITNGRKSFWLSRKPCLKKRLLPYHQEQILAIYLEAERLLKQKQSQLLVRQFAPHLKRKSSGILLSYDTEPLGNFSTLRVELFLLFCCAWAWVDCFPYLYSVHFIV